MEKQQLRNNSMQRIKRIVGDEQETAYKRRHYISKPRYRSRLRGESPLFRRTFYSHTHNSTKCFGNQLSNWMEDYKKKWGVPTKHWGEESHKLVFIKGIFFIKINYKKGGWCQDQIGSQKHGPINIPTLDCYFLVLQAPRCFLHPF